jgi:hypothetical protein
MARCFCGCDRKAPLGRRILNLRGRLVVERLSIVEQRLGRDIDAPAIQEWYATGDDFASSLARYVHREPVDRSSMEPRDIAVWQKFGQKVEREYDQAARRDMRRMKRRMKETGMTLDEYLAAIGRGEIDP